MARARLVDFGLSFDGFGMSAEYDAVTPRKSRLVRSALMAFPKALPASTILGLKLC